MSKPILGYWDVRGLTEPIRYLLHYQNIEFEDKRYGFEIDSWQKDKFSLGLDFPNLPYYIDENVKLTQSITILRYLAKKYGLDGKTEAEKLRVSLIEQQVVDLRMSFARMAYSGDFATSKEDLLKKLPDQLKLLAEFLGDRKFFAGENVTYADFMVYEILDFYALFQKTILHDFPTLKAYHERIPNLPNLRDYLSSSAYVRWPLFAPFAAWGGKGEEPK